MCSAGGEVTVLVLAPKKAFEVEWGTTNGRAIDDSTPLMMEMTTGEGENYDWFQQWDRMMVLRRSEVPSDKRAEAVLLAALRRHLERNGPWNKPEAVEALCHQVFGERLPDLDAIPSEIGGMSPDGYEMQRQDMADDVSVALARPVYVSELNELLPQVLEDERQAVLRSAVGEPIDWNDGDFVGGDLEAAARTKPKCAASCCLYTTGAVLGLVLTAGSLGIAAHQLWPDAAFWSNVSFWLKASFWPQWNKQPAEAGACPRFGDHEAAVVWSSGEPALEEPCGSGTLLCGNDSMTTECNDFGNPWPVSFPTVWNTSREFRHQKCEVFCHTPEQTYSSLVTRLLAHFLLQPSSSNTTPDATPSANTASNTTSNAWLSSSTMTMSREEQVQQIFGVLRYSGGCMGASASWRSLSGVTTCNCAVVNVTCPVMLKSNRAMHDVTVTDFETSLAQLSGSFANYPEDVYEVKRCSYECWNLSTEAKEILRIIRHQQQVTL
ncbi:hypothetical protein GNI_154440 [Gregarina niphandrodes]|uniref:Uncharacterized protein n=1 Tax=Gregarina niphandrodes TaxID=110365 RepID=A0A023AZC0_GRENI|nr:hypothetical protein GNI_154440 [Gregarina niphandrodes]EZG44002.1 hypothetical protein GNI_154440 [Gregarina niphandrodes]|eukprot:XP_011132855.1 hypothetical protein GNI_154440 [Gregarina niphandrodes]